MYSYFKNPYRSLAKLEMGPLTRLAPKKEACFHFTTGFK